MEHLLIQGGDQWLPFARSCIKRLRATGVPYASQRFEAGDSSIKVRIAQEHSYIEITGAALSFLSGVTRDCFTVEVPDSVGVPAYSALDSLKATAEARRLLPKNSDGSPPPTGFALNGRLHIAPQQPTAVLYGLQPEYISGSMYTGKMAKLVQILLGYGKLPNPNKSTTDPDTTIGVKIKYGHRWDKCHGIVTAEDGRLWLVEISNDRGVIAMLLPMRNSRRFSNGASGRAATKALFADADGNTKHAGVPSGETFAADITDDVASGKVKVLITPALMGEFYSKRPHSWLVGWTFNNSGSHALNTCASYASSPTGAYPSREIATGHLYQINFAIGATDSAGNTVATAELVVVEQSPLWSDYDAPFLFMGDNPVSTGSAETTMGEEYGQTVPHHTPTSVAEEGEKVYSEGPVFVCHLNDEIEVVYLCVAWTKYNAGDISFTPHLFIRSTSYSAVESGAYIRSTNTRTETVFGHSWNALNYGGLRYIIEYDHVFKKSDNVTITYAPPSRRGCAAVGARDVYWFGSSESRTRTQTGGGSTVDTQANQIGPYRDDTTPDHYVGSSPPAPYTPTPSDTTVYGAAENGIHISSFGTIPTPPDASSFIGPDGMAYLLHPGEFRGYKYRVEGGTWPYDFFFNRLSVFAVRHSTLGEDLQAVYSANSKTVGLHHVGSFLSGEPDLIASVSADFGAGAMGYSFIGYIPAGAT